MLMGSKTFGFFFCRRSSMLAFCLISLIDFGFFIMEVSCFLRESFHSRGGPLSAGLVSPGVDSVRLFYSRNCYWTLTFSCWILDNFWMKVVCRFTFILDFMVTLVLRFLSIAYPIILSCLSCKIRFKFSIWCSFSWSFFSSLGSSGSTNLLSSFLFAASFFFSYLRFLLFF